MLQKGHFTFVELEALNVIRGPGSDTSRDPERRGVAVGVQSPGCSQQRKSSCHLQSPQISRKVNHKAGNVRPSFGGDECVEQTGHVLRRHWLHAVGGAR